MVDEVAQVEPGQRVDHQMEVTHPRVRVSTFIQATVAPLPFQTVDAVSLLETPHQQTESPPEGTESALGCVGNRALGLPVELVTKRRRQRGPHATVPVEVHRGDRTLTKVLHQECAGLTETSDPASGDESVGIGHRASTGSHQITFRER